MTDQAPSLGRIVLVAADPATNNGAHIAPAIITRVWNDTTVNLRVLTDSDAIQWRTSATLVDDLDQLDADDPGRLGHWTWPPRT